MATPAVLTGCQGDSPTQSASGTDSSMVISSSVSVAGTGSESASPAAAQPKPFTAADGTYSLVLPDGFVEQSSDAATGTTTWLHPKKKIVLVATSVKKALEPESLSKEAMAQTLSAAYEQAEIKAFEQSKKGDGTLFFYDADVTQNGVTRHLMQVLYTDADQTVTLVMTLDDESQQTEGREMMQAMAASLKAL